MSLSMTFGGVNKFFQRPQAAKPEVESNSKGLLSRIADVSTRLKNKAIEIATTDINAESMASAAQVLTKAVKKSVQHVRSMSREDWAWAGGTIGLGIVAKTAVLAATGLATGGTTLAAAAVGGATVGLVKSGVKIYRDYKKNEIENPAQSFWSTKTLMTSVSHAALSTATFGLFEGVEAVTGVNVGQKIAQGVGSIASNAFDKVATGVKTTQSIGWSLLKALTNLIPSADAAELPRPAANLSPVAAAPVAVPAPAPAVVTSAQQASLPPQVSKDIAAAREVGKQMALAAAQAKTPAEIAQEAIKKASAAVAQQKLTDSYVQQRLSDLILRTTGVAPASNASALELSKQFLAQGNHDHRIDAQTFVKAITQQAPQIKVENLAGSCTTAIPNKPQSTHVINTICHKFKAMMGGADIVVVEDTNNPDVKSGVQVYHRGVVSAPGGVETAKPTHDFMMDNITGPDGDIPHAIEKAVAKLAEVQPQ